MSVQSRCSAAKISNHKARTINITGLFQTRYRPQNVEISLWENIWDSFTHSTDYTDRYRTSGKLSTHVSRYVVPCQMVVFRTCAWEPQHGLFESAYSDIGYYWDYLHSCKDQKAQFLGWSFLDEHSMYVFPRGWPGLVTLAVHGTRPFSKLSEFITRCDVSFLLDSTEHLWDCQWRRDAVLTGHVADDLSLSCGKHGPHLVKQWMCGCWLVCITLQNSVL